MNPELIFTRVIARENVDELVFDKADVPSLSLPFERRQIARQRVVLSHGGDSEAATEAGLKLPRGTILRTGDLLMSDDERYARVVAAAEEVSLVRCDNAQSLARAAYHLGNRHVWVQVGDHWLRYLHDHVLDEMVVGLGLSVVAEQAPFEPEAGAYASHETSGSHSHAH